MSTFPEPRSTAAHDPQRRSDTSASEFAATRSIAGFCLLAALGLGGCVTEDGNTGLDAGGSSGDGGVLSTADGSSEIVGRPCQSDLDCQTDDLCAVGVCEVGKCALQDGPDGFVCDDHNVCTLQDKCFGGACLGKLISCSDGNSCTTDFCDPVSGCTLTPTNQSCSDGDPCVAYRCEDGSCFAAGSSCDDGNPCTLEDCSSTLGCRTVALSGPACDDGNPCTLDDGCAFGACKGTGDCDDNNPCTADSCSIGSGCIHKFLKQACTDGDICTGFDHCAGGACVGTPKSCNDGNPCTMDSCNPKNGTCTSKAIGEGGACDDGNPCTLQTLCTTGLCVATSVKNCADTDPCTDDKCVFPTGVCLHTPAFNCSKK